MILFYIGEQKIPSKVIFFFLGYLPCIKKSSSLEKDIEGFKKKRKV